MNYSKGLLQSRAIIEHGKFALIPPEGLVNNVIPGFENCTISILASPKLGAGFVDYIVTMHEGGQNSVGFGGAGVETFIYVLAGKVKAWAAEEEVELEESGYLYCPPHKKLYVQNMISGDSKIFLYKQRYQSLEGCKPWIVSGHAYNTPKVSKQEGKVHLQDLLPKELDFDMNFHILSFEPAAGHLFVETHIQQHGAYILSGEAMYNLNNKWIPVQKGDYIFMGPYVPQAAYAVGSEKLSYLYSKDCNRDELI